MTLTTELRELLEAPQWDDNPWLLQLQSHMAGAVDAATMFRPWLESFATVHEMLDEGIVDGEPKMERFVLPDINGRQVAWLAPGGNVDMTAMIVRVFEPPAQWVSRSATINLDRLKESPVAAVAETILALAADLDDAFRRRITALRALGDVHVALWSGLRTRGSILGDGDEPPSWQLQGKYLIAAAAVGPENAAAAPEPQPAPDGELTVEQEKAALQAHLDETAAEADAEPRREPYDEPAGDLREVEPDDQSLLARAEDFSAVGGMGGTRRVQ